MLFSYFEVTLVIFITIYQQCNAQLKQIEPQQQNIYQINLESSSTFGIGCFFQYTPLKYTVEIFEDKQTMLLNAIDSIIDQQNYFIHMIEIDYLQNSITHIIQINSINKIKIPFSSLQYEGQWILYYLKYSQLTHQAELIMSNINGQIYKNILTINNMFPSSKMNSKFGGYYNIQNANTNQQEKIFNFKGNIFIIDYQSLQYKVSQSTLQSLFPQLKVSCGSAKFTQNWLNLNQNSYLTGYTDSICVNRMVEGWIKFNQVIIFNIQNVEDEVTLIQIGQSKFKQPQLYLIGNLFNLIYKSDSADKIMILVQTYSYKFPNPRQLIAQDPSQLLEYSILIDSINIYEWHYFKFISSGNTSTSFEIAFPKFDQHYFHSFGKIYTFTAGQFFYFIGGTQDSIQYFKGVLSNFSLISNSIQLQMSFSITCHFSCKTCYGPLYNNCLLCDSKKFRIFDKETNSCVCEFGLPDLNIAACQNFNAFKVEYELPLIVDNVNLALNQCEFGHYKYNSICYKCPTIFLKNIISCADCLLDPEGWSNDMICTYDYILNNTVFQLTKKDYYQKEQFLLSNNQTILCFGCQATYPVQPSLYRLSKYFSKELQQFVYCKPKYEVIDYYCQIPLSYPNQSTSQIIECGQFCASCSATQCYYCYDPEQYFLSSDGQNCELCLIENCQYCYIYDKQSEGYSTLTQNLLQRSRLINTLQVGCAKCRQEYTFSFLTGKCEIRQYATNCLQQYENTNADLICLLRNSDKIIQNEAINNCLNYIANCQICTNFDNSFQLQCLTCAFGYYFNKMSKICVVCREAQSNCHQYNPLYQDFWMQQIELFYYKVYQNYILYDQISITSLKLQYDSCKLNYRNIQNQCYPQCFDSCLDCDFNGDCLSCSSSKYGTKQLTFQQNSGCIECPFLCELCVDVNSLDYTVNNPFFLVDQQTQIYTKQCIKSQVKANNNIYINSQKQVLICENNLPKCQIKIIKKFFFTCQNIFMLGMSRVAYVYLTDSEVDLINFKQVKIVEFHMILNYSQECVANGLTFTAAQRNKLFSIQQFNIVVEGIDNQTTLIISQFFKILRFDEITINNLNIKSQFSTQIFPFLIENTDIPQIITFNNCQILYSNNTFYIEILNLQELIIHGTNISNFNQESEIIKISNIIDIGTVSFNLSNITINNLLTTKPIFYISASSNIAIQIQYLSFINSNFTDSFISVNCITNSIKITTSNFLINQTIFNHYSFIKGGFESFSTITLTNIFNSHITNSIMFQGSDFFIDSFTIIDNYFQNSSLLSQFEMAPQFDIKIIQMTLNNNTFNECINIFNLISIRNCYISNVILQQNQFEGYNNQVLFYFMGIQLHIQNVQIIKSGQFLGFQFDSFSNVRINQIQYSDHISPQNSLSQFSDCFDRPTSFNLFKINDCEFVDLQNIQISNSSVVDNSLIMISFSQFTNQRQEISLSNMTFYNLLIVRLKVDISVALVQIQYTSNPNITIFDIVYDFIWMHQYQQELLSISAPLLYINSLLSRVIFENIAINKILMTNSSDSTIIIQSNEVLMQNISVKNINDITQNQFDYFYIWGFYDEFQLYYETITQILELKSIGGFASITAQYIEVNQLFANHIQAASAGIFKIITQKVSSVVIMNSNFTDIQATSLYNSNGGCIFIDAINSKLSLKVTNLIIENVFNLHSGGVIYILPSQNYNMITITDIEMSRVYSNQGTFLYVEFQNEYSNHYVIIEHLYVFDCFINDILNEHMQNFYQTDLTSYLTDCFVIDIKGGQIKLKDLFIQNVEYLGIFKILNAINIIADQVQLQNCSTSFNQLITFKFQVSSQFFFHLNQIQISKSQNTILNSNQPQFNCAQINTQILIQQNQIYKSDCKFQIKNYKIQSFFFNETLKQCLISTLQQSVQNNQKIDSLVNVVLNNLTNIYFNQLMFNKVMYYLIYQVSCGNCQNGLLGITVNNKKNQQDVSQVLTLLNLYFYNNDCGQIGCLTLINSTQIDDILFIIENQTQILIYDSQSQTQINIQESLFSNNTANYVAGICILELSSSISNTIFVNNSAQISSNIYSSSLFTRISIANIFSSNNQNFDGGTVFVKGFPPLLQGENIFVNNLGIDYSFIPSKLRVEYCQQLLPNKFIDQMDFAIFGEYKIFGQEKLVENLMIPSGQQIDNYVYFDSYSLNLINYNLSLRIKAINDYDEVITNLEGYSCNISQLNQGKLENMQIVQFSLKTLDFNLDKFIFKLDPYNNQPHTIRVECDCLKNSNYSVNFNISAFKCQQGEYYFDEQCLTCDARANYYSLDPFLGKCEIMNDVTTMEIKSSMIRLRAGYWRSNALSSTILACKNQPLNCQGGWITGDLSCKIGNLGALCEQCDLYNFLGQGSYSRNNQFKCNKCTNFDEPIIKLGIIFLWTLFSLYTAVGSQIECTFQFKLLKLTNKHYEILSKYTQNETSVILKMITNFLQIIWTILIFYNNYSINLSEIITIFGDSAGQISSSFDCISSQYLNDLPYYKVIMMLGIQILLSVISLKVYLIKILIYKSRIQRTVVWTLIICTYLLTYQSIINELTLLLSYRKISNEYYVTGYTDILYLSANHQQWLWKLIIPFTIIFSVLLPFIILIYIRKAIKILDKVKIKERFGYLINEYRQESYYWEFIKFLFRTLYVSVLNIFSDQIALKSAFILMLLTLYQILLFKVQPYSQPYLNQIEIQSTTICIICIFIANTLQYISNEESVWQLPFIIVQAFLIVYQMIVFIALFYKRLKSKVLQKVLKMNCIQKMSIVDKYMNSQRQKDQNIIQRFQQVKKYLKSQTIILKQVQVQIKNQTQIQTQINNQYQLSSYRGATDRIQISSPINASILLKDHIKE